MKRATLVVLLLGGALLLTGQTRTGKTVEAGEFVLQDRAGKVRAVLGFSQQGPRLMVLGPDGKGVASIGAVDQTRLGSIALYGNEGNFLSMGPEGLDLVRAGDSPGQVSLDLDKSGAASLSLRGNRPAISLVDKQGFSAAIGSTDLLTRKIGESHRTSAASMVFFGKDKEVLWSAP